MRHGDQDARRRLIESQLPLVVSIARRYVRPHVPLDDLCQVGAMALIRCLTKFRPRKGRLSTFCHQQILWSLDHFVAKNRSLVSRPANRPAPHLSAAWDAALDVVSLDEAPVKQIACADESGEVLDADQNELRWRQLEAAAFARLTPQQALVLRGRLDGLLLRELAAEIGVSKERVRQIYQAAIARLQAELIGSAGAKP
jgi:RNA polymerase sigma factor (sigma-70 family)